MTLGKLKKDDFPDIDYARSLDVKIKGRWVTIYNFILRNWTVKGREKIALRDWPEFAMVTAEYPADSQFRITSTLSIIPFDDMITKMRLEGKL